jgi:hypothetical protein
MCPVSPRLARTLTLFNLLVFSGLFLGAAGCPKRVVEDAGSELALRAGQATVVLGSCERGFERGFSACQLRKGAPLPPLELLFLQPGDYAVSDCDFGILESGSAPEPGLVKIDLEKIDRVLQERGFCLLKVEAVERYPDARDPRQLHEVPVSGGFYLEALPDGYLPEPSDEVVAWECVVKGTTKGRRSVRCK